MKPKGPKKKTPQPTTYHMVDTAKLQPGDILLSASPGQAVSDTIRKVTGEDYSHAMLVLIPPYFVESADAGVTKLRLDSYAALDPRNVMIRRPTNATLKKLNMKELLKFA